MNTQERQQQIREEQSQRDHKLFCVLAAALADGKLTLQHACSMIESVRDAKIFVLEPKNQAEEQQNGFNEIAGIFADYKISKVEACELFVEWKKYRPAN